MKAAARPFFSVRPALAVGLLLAAAAVFWFARNFVLSAYYRETVAVLDGGWFAGVLHGSDWRLTNPIVLGANQGSYYDTHVALFLVPFTYAAKILPLSSAEYMAVFLGIAFALYAVLLFIAAADFLARQNPPLKTPLVAAVAAPVAFVVALNGVSAEILHYPHFEAWLPVLVCAFLLALAFEKKKTAAAAFILLVINREDGGFHLATSLLAIVFFRQFPPRKTFAAQKESILAEKELLLWSAAAILCSLIAINSAGMHAPRPTVFDARALSHLKSVLLRVDWAPALVVVAAWAAYTRKPSALIGFAALIPWVAYSIPQEHPLRAHMGSYYGFPVLVALFWPFIAGRFFPDSPARRGSQKKRREKESRAFEAPRASSPAAIAFAIVFAASTLVFRPRESVVYNEMRVPKVGALQLFTEGATPVPARARENIRKLRDFFLARADELNIITADGFASLHPHDVPARRLLYRGPLKLEQNDAGVLIAHDTWMRLFAKSVFAARAAFDLTHAYRLRETGGPGQGFFLFSKKPLCDESQKCADDLPLDPVRVGDSFYDLAGGEISRDSFYFPGPALAAEGVQAEEQFIFTDAAGTAAELKNLPLDAGKTALLTEYAYDAESEPPPTLEVEWPDGRLSSPLPPIEGGQAAAAVMVIDLPSRQNITARVTHGGGGTLRVFGLLFRPPPEAAQ